MIAWLFVLIMGARAEMIFLDLNDAPQEIKACEEGIQTGNMTSERRERLHVVDPSKHRRQPGENYQRTPAYHALRAKLRDMVSRGIPVDSIVISGEDGSGEFFGSQGKFHYYELNDLVNEFPSVAKTLKSAAVWGCYTTTVNGSEQFWLNKLPNMQFTMGFTTQGPNKTRPANHALLKQFCQRRQEAAEATSMDALCRFYDSLQQLTPTSVAVCNRTGVATREYAVGGQAEKCFTYRQLHDRCSNFINNKDLQGIYDRYMSGATEPPEDTEARLTDLRYYYNELNKWRHCAQKYKHQRGTDMPFPPNVIRLIKYQKVKKNLAEVNRSEIAEYDAALERAGLGALKLGDITQLSRRTLHDRINAAVAALSGSNVTVPATTPAPTGPAPNQSRPCNGAGFMFTGCETRSTATAAPMSTSPTTVRAVNDPTLHRMAECMRQTFIQMNHECVPFDSVGNSAKTKSSCLMDYEEAKERHEDDAC